MKTWTADSDVLSKNGKIITVVSGEDQSFENDEYMARYLARCANAYEDKEEAKR